MSLLPVPSFPVDERNTKQQLVFIFKFNQSLLILGVKLPNLKTPDYFHRSLYRSILLSDIFPINQIEKDHPFSGHIDLRKDIHHDRGDN